MNAQLYTLRDVTRLPTGGWTKFLWSTGIRVGSPVQLFPIISSAYPGRSLGIITYLRSNIVVSEEMTSLPLENLRALHDEVIKAIDKLDKWANSPTGGSSAMPSAYVSIKDWIGTRQRDPKSV